MLGREKRSPAVARTGRVPRGCFASRLLAHFEPRLGRSEKVTDKGWQSLGGLPLRIVAFRKPSVLPPEAWKSIAQMPELTQLIVTWGELDEKSLRELGGCSKLVNLDLRDTRISESGVEVLAGVKTLTC